MCVKKNVRQMTSATSQYWLASMIIVIVTRSIGEGKDVGAEEAVSRCAP
jgi:hypothetical protein